jgi:branched-chain amino acid transport system permease protein
VELLLSQTFNALALAGAYAILAISLTFIYGVTDILHFGHAESAVVGGYAGFVVATFVPSLLLAVAVAALVTAVLGWVVYDGLFRWLKGPNHVALIGGIALGLLLQEGLRLVFGGYPISYPATLGGSRDTYEVITLGLALAVTVSFELFMRKSRYGRALRAVADNREMSRLLGIRVVLMERLTFIIGSAMAGASGVLLALILGFLSPFLGASLILGVTAMVLVGGLGSVAGAILGAVAIAFSQVFSTTYISSTYRDAITFGLIIVVLLVRPQGLLGVGREPRA